MLNLNPYKVLLIDDNIVTVTYLKFLLDSKKGKYEVIIAYNAEDGLQLLTDCNPNIVLLDLNLPNMNGLTACNLIKKKYPQLPVIIITAELDPSEEMNAYKAGADGYLAKPFSPTALFSIINYHLSRPEEIQIPSTC